MALLLHRDTQSDTQLSMTDIYPIIKAANRYGVDRQSLLNIVHSYIKNLNREIYLIRLAQLCYSRDNDVYQFVRDTVELCAERYHGFPNVLHSGFVCNRFIVFYSEHPQ